jgi:hypothetical protein
MRQETKIEHSVTLQNVESGNNDITISLLFSLGEASDRIGQNLAAIGELVDIVHSE